MLVSLADVAEEMHEKRWEDSCCLVLVLCGISTIAFVNEGHRSVERLDGSSKARKGCERNVVRTCLARADVRRIPCGLSGRVLVQLHVQDVLEDERQ